MRSDLLLKLADLLDTVPPETFDYGEWFSKLDGVEDVRPGACGTTACALGWATTLPELKGVLALRRSQGFHPVSKTLYVVIHVPTGLPGAKAAMMAFDLSEEEVEELFMPNGPDERRRAVGRPDETASPREVAAWIRTWLQCEEVVDAK